MTEPILLLVEFDGAVFRPVNPRVRDRCAELFETGETYRIEISDNRSAESHNAFFAAIARAWRNLPDNVARKFPSAKHFRSWLLVQNGFADERQVVCDTEDDARRFAAEARLLDSYAVIIVRNNVVTIYTAQSMAAKAMPRKTFEIAKQLLIAQAAEMIGISAAELSQKPSDEPDHAHEQPNRIEHADPPEGITGLPADAPATASPGGPTPVVATSTPTQDGVAPTHRDGSGQTESPGGGELKPTNFTDYEKHLKTWLGFVTSRKRIRMKYTKEQSDFWPHIRPDLTNDQVLYLDSLMKARMQELPDAS